MRGCRNLRFDCIQKYSSLSEFSSFSFNISNKIVLTVHDITISEPHYLLFYSVNCKCTAAIRQRLEMPHFR